MLRVLHVVEAFGGGLFEVVRHLAEAGARSGDEVAVAYGVREQTPADVRGKIAKDVELIPVSSWQRGGIVRLIGAPRELRAIVRQWHPDLIHLHSSFAGAAGAVSLAGQTTVFSPQALPSSLVGRNPLSRIFYRAVEKGIVKRVTLVHAASPAEAHYAKKVLGAVRVETIENGIPELEDPGPPPAREQPQVVVASGRITAQRRPQACARILERLGDVATTRWVGGGVPGDGDSGLSALEEAGVEVTGWVTREQSLEQMGRASAYLHWTSADGQALSIMEAMALDVPIVASDIPASRDILPPEQLCAGEDEAAELLRRILEDPEFAERIRAGQRARRGHYSASRMTDEVLALYRRLRAER